MPPVFRQICRLLIARLVVVIAKGLLLLMMIMVIMPWSGIYKILIACNGSCVPVVLTSIDLVIKFA